MLARMTEDRGELATNGENVAPVHVGDANPSVRCIEPALGQDDDAIGDETWKDRRREVLAYFIQAQASGFTLRIPAVSAHRREVIVAEDDRCLIEIGAAIAIGGNDERV